MLNQSPIKNADQGTIGKPYCYTNNNHQISIQLTKQQSYFITYSKS